MDLPKLINTGGGHIILASLIRLLLLFIRQNISRVSTNFGGIRLLVFLHVKPNMEKFRKFFF